MTALLNYINGKKTYILAFLFACYTAGWEQTLWPHVAWVDAAFAALGAATLRHAVAKSGPVSDATEDKTE